MKRYFTYPNVWTFSLLALVLGAIAIVLSVPADAASAPALATLQSFEHRELLLGALAFGGITADAFKSDIFTLRSMTAAINDLPHVPKRIGELGVFREQGITTLDTFVEIKGNQLYLVADKPRGGPAQQNIAEKREGIPLRSRHLPVQDFLAADEVQGVRQFASESEMEMLQAKRDERLATMRRSLEATIEHHRMGAIKGEVLDADGTRVLYNLFDKFEISQITPFDFDLDNADPAPDAIERVQNQIIRAMEDELGNTSYTGVHCFCDATFFDDLVTKEEVKRAYERWRDGEFLREQTARRTFWFKGVMYEEYRGKVGGVSYVAPGDAHFFPVGTPDNFILNFSPANYNETVNTMGLPYYAKSKPNHEETGLDIWAQSNPLAVCTRPRTLIKGTRT